MGKAYTTPQVANMIGVHTLTIHRWLKAGKIKPGGVTLSNGSILWQWSDSDIAKAKSLKQPPGRPRKAGKK